MDWPCGSSHFDRIGPYPSVCTKLNCMSCTSTRLSQCTSKIDFYLFNKDSKKVVKALSDVEVEVCNMANKNKDGQSNNAGSSVSPVPSAEELSKRKEETLKAEKALAEEAQTLAELSELEARERTNNLLKERIQELKEARDRAKVSSLVLIWDLATLDPASAKLL